PFAGDVYTIGSNGSLIAVDPSMTPLTAPLFNLASSPLNLTWGAWRAASATTSVREHGGPAQPRTTVRLQLTGLVPHGVYSVFYRTFSPDSNNPLCPNVEPSLVLGSTSAAQPGATDLTVQGSWQNAAAFTSDGAGNASVRGTVDGRLLDAQQLQ